MLLCRVNCTSLCYFVDILLQTSLVNRFCQVVRILDLAKAGTIATPEPELSFLGINVLREGKTVSGEHNASNKAQRLCNSSPGLWAR